MLLFSQKKQILLFLKRKMCKVVKMKNNNIELISKLNQLKFSCENIRNDINSTKKYLDKNIICNKKLDDNELEKCLTICSRIDEKLSLIINNLGDING